MFYHLQEEGAIRGPSLTEPFLSKIQSWIYVRLIAITPSHFLHQIIPDETTFWEEKGMKLYLQIQIRGKQIYCGSTTRCKKRRYEHISKAKTVRKIRIGKKNKIYKDPFRHNDKPTRFHRKMANTGIEGWLYIPFQTAPSQQIGRELEKRYIQTFRPNMNTKDKPFTRLKKGKKRYYRSGNRPLRRRGPKRKLWISTSHDTRLPENLKPNPRKTWYRLTPYEITTFKVLKYSLTHGLNMKMKMNVAKRRKEKLLPVKKQKRKKEKDTKQAFTSILRNFNGCIIYLSLKMGNFNLIDEKGTNLFGNTLVIYGNNFISLIEFQKFLTSGKTYDFIIIPKYSPPYDANTLFWFHTIYKHYKKNILKFQYGPWWRRTC